MAGKKRLLVVLTVIAALCMFAATGMAAEKVLKLGVLGPFTGPAANTGKQFKGSVEMALEKIGGKIGDYKIEPVWIDSQSDPAKATNAYAEACERAGIQAGVLNWHSSVAVAVMDVAAQYKVPHMFGFGATEVVNDKWKKDPKKYSYWGGKGWPVPGTLMSGYVTAVNDAVRMGLFKPKKKLVAIWGEDTDWGRSAGGALKEKFANSGWEIFSEDYFPATQTDFYAMLSKYKSAGVAVLAGTSASPPNTSALVKQADEIGLKSLMIVDGLGWIGDWYKLMGNASNYVLDMIPQLSTKAAQAWAKKVKTEKGYTVSPSSGGLAYDGTGFMLKILKRTYERDGKLDKASIHKTMVEEVNTGKLTYTEADGAIIMKEYKYTPETMPDPVVGPANYFFPVIQYKNGKGSIIFPKAWATKKLELKK